MRDNALNSKWQRHCEYEDYQLSFILGKFPGSHGLSEGQPHFSLSPQSSTDIPRGGSRLCDHKATGIIVSSKGKALNKAEFKVDYNKCLGPWASVTPHPLLQMTAETKAAEPGVWAEFSSHNYTADVWGRATVSAEGDSFCSCTKNTASSNMLISCLLPSNNIEGRLRKGHTMPTHLANSVTSPINLDGLSIKHHPPQRTELTRCLSFCWPILA